jgi:NADPH:quinone reductase-like Zn-dependent oxidoreductase
MATTSSKEKAEKLKDLGATHVINYKEDASWRNTAKGLTPGYVGVRYVLELGGPATLAEILKAVHIDGVSSIVGFVAGDNGRGATELPKSVVCVRGVSVGSRALFEETNGGIEANDIRLVVDERMFELEHLREAYRYMWEQRHFGKSLSRLHDEKSKRQPSSNRCSTDK